MRPLPVLLIGVGTGTVLGPYLGGTAIWWGLGAAATGVLLGFLDRDRSADVAPDDPLTPQRSRLQELGPAVVRIVETAEEQAELIRRDAEERAELIRRDAEAMLTSAQLEADAIVERARARARDGDEAT